MPNYSEILSTGFLNFLPQELKSRKNQGVVGKTMSSITWLTFALYALLMLCFVGSYLLIHANFNPETRSIQLPPVINLGLSIWGTASFFLYYFFDIRKGIYVLLPGIIFGGSFCLALVGFAIEAKFPGIVFHTHLAVLTTVFWTYGLYATRIFDRYPNLELWLISAGSITMYLMAYVAGLSWLSEIFTFNFKVMFGSIALIFLMAILTLFHLKMVEEISTKTRTFTDELHLAANAIFIFFILYLCFLMLLAAARSRK